jgi:hypothetical protein
MIGNSREGEESGIEAVIEAEEFKVADVSAGNTTTKLIFSNGRLFL